jgi:hypothetical protein
MLSLVNLADSGQKFMVRLRSFVFSGEVVLINREFFTGARETGLVIQCQ